MKSGESGESGDAAAAEDLLAAVYDELRQVARARLAFERPDHTLQPTALVHEAWLRLAQQQPARWQGRTHVIALAAQAMRRLLVDHARARDRDKRGGDWTRVTLGDADRPFGPALDQAEIVALDDALRQLATLDPRQARIVELRFFGGLTVQAVAELLGVSKRTVEDDWMHASAWLRRRLAPMTLP